MRRNERPAGDSSHAQQRLLLRRRLRQQGVQESGPVVGAPLLHRALQRVCLCWRGRAALLVVLLQRLQARHRRWRRHGRRPVQHGAAGCAMLPPVFFGSRRAAGAAGRQAGRQVACQCWSRRAQLCPPRSPPPPPTPAAHAAASIPCNPPGHALQALLLAGWGFRAARQAAAVCQQLLEPHNVPWRALDRSGTRGVHCGDVNSSKDRSWKPHAWRWRRQRAAAGMGSQARSPFCQSLRLRAPVSSFSKWCTAS